MFNIVLFLKNSNDERFVPDSASKEICQSKSVLTKRYSTTFAFNLAIPRGNNKFICCSHMLLKILCETQGMRMERYYPRMPIEGFIYWNSLQRTIRCKGKCSLKTVIELCSTVVNDIYTKDHCGFILIPTESVSSGTTCNC